MTPATGDHAAPSALWSVNTAASALDLAEHKTALATPMDEFATTNLAVLAMDGTILRVNHDWRAYGQSNGQRDPCCGVGRNYFAVCAAAGDCADAQRAAETLRRVARGAIRSGQFIYPCHSQKARRWYRCCITKPVGAGYILVSHDDVTAWVERRGEHKKPAP